MARPDPVPVARTLVELLPVLIEQAASTGGPLALAVYAMRTALAEAQRVAAEAAKPSSAITATVDALRRMGD